MSKELPSWAEIKSPGYVDVQADQFYPAILAELGVEDGAADQYWLQVAKNIMKMDVRVAVAGTENAAPATGALTILVQDNTKVEGVSKYALKVHPEGKGATAGAREARDHYKRLRGFLPA